MSIFAIGDLHLSFSSEKPMDIYGGQWINHTERLKSNWEKLISEEDTVMLIGDTSWALRLEDYAVDATWISNLPGKKVLIKGNHDLWWSTLTKLKRVEADSLTYIQNTFGIAVSHGKEYAICGTRGWLCPGDDNFSQKDEKIYLRELNRLELSLIAARKAGFGGKGAERGKILCGIHYPPTNDKHQGSGFTELFTNYGVETVVYGHLHGSEAYKNGIKGIFNGISYNLVSLDYVKCEPFKII